MGSFSLITILTSMLFIVFVLAGKDIFLTNEFSFLAKLAKASYLLSEFVIRGKEV